MADHRPGEDKVKIIICIFRAIIKDTNNVHALSTATLTKYFLVML